MLKNRRKVRLSMTAGMTIAAVACGMQVAPDKSARTYPTHAPTNAVTCVKGHDKSIDKAGGTVALPGGHHLHVPQGAVTGQTPIRFTIQALNEDYVGVEVRRVGGSQTTFNPPLRLRFSYSGCHVPNEAGLGIYKWTPQPAPGRWDRLDDQDFYLDTDADTISARLPTLSEYALGAG